MSQSYHALSSRSIVFGVLIISASDEGFTVPTVHGHADGSEVERVDVYRGQGRVCLEELLRLAGERASLVYLPPLVLGSVLLAVHLGMETSDDSAERVVSQFTIVLVVGDDLLQPLPRAADARVIDDQTFV